MSRIIRFILLLCVLLVADVGELPAQDKTRTSRWEPEIKAFERSDRTNPPPRRMTGWSLWAFIRAC
jgi:hypothetical protein